jgi:hypothetical protein
LLLHKGYITPYRQQNTGVIGNPPYVEAKKLKATVAAFRTHYSCSSGTADLSVYFYERGLNMTAENGILSYICTNKFFATEYGAKLRVFLRKYDLWQILNFEQCEVFEGVLVSSAITFVSNRVSSNRTVIDFLKLENLNYHDFMSAFATESANLTDYPLSELTEKEWSFADTEKLGIKAKIETSGVPIGKTPTLHVYRGVTTGYNPAFIINNEKRNELITADRRCAYLIKNLLQGRNIRKWFYNESDENLIQTGYDIDISKLYPTVYSFLYQWIEPLKARADQGLSWWNLRACKYYSEFERNEKIIWGLTADKWAFAYDNKQHYLPSNGYILTSDEIPVKYLLGLLNSRLLQFYFSFIGIMTAGGAYTLKAATIEALPIHLATPKQQSPIIALVNHILSLKKADSMADTTPLEKEIDKLVYQLYGLTEEEITIVERMNAK